jgi:hypothetical protein
MIATLLLTKFPRRFPAMIKIRKAILPSGPVPPIGKPKPYSEKEAR